MLLSLAWIAFAAGSSDERGSFASGDPGPFADGGAEGGECDHTKCSRDLKQVLRGCEGAETVVEACGDGLGCGDGRCVPACESAALSKGSLGCEFLTVAPDDKKYNVGDCFVAMVANTWDRPVSIRVELGGTPLDISQSVYTAYKDGADTRYIRVGGQLPSGQVDLVFLSDAAEEGSARGTAFGARAMSCRLSTPIR